MTETQARWLALPWTLLKIAGYRYCVDSALMYLETLAKTPNISAKHRLETVHQLERDIIRLSLAIKELPWQRAR